MHTRYTGSILNIHQVASHFGSFFEHHLELFPQPFPQGFVPAEDTCLEAEDAEHVSNCQERAQVLLSS